MSHKVFLSYTYQDHELAELFKSRIAELLPQENKETVDVFDARTDLVVGMDIRRSIKVAIEAASTIVIISSESADASPWVNYEIGLADAMGKDLVIVGKKEVEDTALLRRFFDTARIVKIENG